MQDEGEKVVAVPAGEGNELVEETIENVPLEKSFF